jgi:hypothetical protein
MGSGMRSGNDKVSKVNRTIDPRSVATLKEMRGGAQSQHHRNVQERGNLDGAMRSNRSEEGCGYSSTHEQLKSDKSNMDGKK